MTDGRLAALLAGLALVAYGVLLPTRAPMERIWGDEGTYLAMARSLVHDRDLRFDDDDRTRVETAAAENAGAGSLILERAGDGSIAYSKPILYPLLAAPFVALAGDVGPMILNALLLAAALVLAHAFLRRSDPGGGGAGGRAALAVVTFAGAGVVLPYVLWRMGDVLQVALAIAGVALTCADLRLAGRRGRGRREAGRPGSEGEGGGGPGGGSDPGDGPGVAERFLEWRYAPWLGAALLGLLVSARLTNALVAAVPVLAYFFARRPRRALALVPAIAVSYLLLVALTFALTGHPDPYRAPRTSFTTATGYPAGAGADDARARFDLQPATHGAPLLRERGDRILYSAGYFWLGRHTGFVFYFPAALALLAAALRRPDPLATAILLIFAASAAFYVVWLPENYFGGHTFIGNRYVLAAYGTLLLAPRVLPGRRLVAVAWLVAVVGFASALVSGQRSRDIPVYPSQRHAHAGLFRLLPYESTAQDLMSRDRYWAESFVRFVDPFARPRDDDFVLASDRPPAELLIARWQPGEVFRFAVETGAPEAWLELRDRGHRRRYPVGRTQIGGARRTGDAVIVEFAPAPAWRHHRFWFYPEKRYRAHTLRLALYHPPDRPPARARVRLLTPP